MGSAPLGGAVPNMGSLPNMGSAPLGGVVTESVGEAAVVVAPTMGRDVPRRLSTGSQYRQLM
jgi:hypothetical protein